jgi:hypothetical protein
MNQLHEGLNSGDLKDLIDSTFEVDAYKSKMGDDENIVVLSFEIYGKHAAKDLSDFIERGFESVIDADVSQGEVSKGVYRVFVELQRNSQIVEQIDEIMYGLTELSGIEDWRFRYFRDYQSKPIVDLRDIVPKSAQEYKSKMEGIFENELRFFFRRSPLDYLLIENDTLVFKRSFNSPIRMKLVDQGTRTDILNKLAGMIRVDESSTAETTWLTKYFGDYNITKYGDHFVFENDNTVMVFELKNN